MAQIIKGLVLKARLNFMEHVYGPDALQKVLAQLKGKTRDVMAKPKYIKATTWFDISVNQELDDAICTVLAGGDEAVFLQMGAFSNEFQAKNAPVDHFKSPWKWLKFHVIAFPRFYDPGRLEVIKLNEGECLMRFHDISNNKHNCLTNLGFTKKGLEMCGAKDVSVVETKCRSDPGNKFCEFRITFRWDPSMEPQLHTMYRAP